MIFAMEMVGRPRQAQEACPALILAASNGHTDCVRLLLEGGADKEARDNVRDIQFYTYCIPRSTAFRL